MEPPLERVRSWQRIYAPVLGDYHVWIDANADYIVYGLVFLLSWLHWWWGGEGDDAGLWGVYLYLTTVPIFGTVLWVAQSVIPTQIMVGLVARQAPRWLQGLIAKSVARANFERRGFEDRVNISLSSLVRPPRAICARAAPS